MKCHWKRAPPAQGTEEINTFFHTSEAERPVFLDLQNPLHPPARSCCVLPLLAGQAMKSFAEAHRDRVYSLAMEDRVTQ